MSAGSLTYSPPPKPSAQLLEMSRSRRRFPITNQTKVVIKKIKN